MHMQNRLRDIENKLVVTKGEKERGLGINEGYSIN